MSKRHRAITGRLYRKARVARARTREAQAVFLDSFFFGRRIPKSMARTAKRL